MKKYIVAAGLFLLMNSCLNNDFMEVYPKDQQTELTSFRSYENFKTYSWGLYNVFFGYAYKTGQTDEIFKGDYGEDRGKGTKFWAATLPTSCTPNATTRSGTETATISGGA